MLVKITNFNKYISIHAPSRERHGRGNGFSKSFTISIHAPSRERQNFNKYEIFRVVISIHAPSRERHDTIRHSDDWFTFQSTLPRGSDSRFSSITLTSFNFNPRSLAGAT